MARQLPSHAIFLIAALALLGLAACEVPTGALETAGDFSEADLDLPVAFGMDREVVGSYPIDTPDGYVVGPETVAVFVGEELVVELELLEPDSFSLRPGVMPEDAEFTAFPGGGVLFWRPEIDDVGTHEFSVLVVDVDEPNLVIAQEMLVVDVIPRHRFIEYGF
jgi:hypothetical protein